MALLLTVGTLSAQDNKKWYVKGNLQAAYLDEDGNDTWGVGLGVGIHRMLGDKFSLGLDLGWATMKSSPDNYNEINAMVNFAYFGKLGQNFFYVPEVQAGVVMDATKNRDNEMGFGAGISPFGLEYRPCAKWGLRLNVVNFTYSNLWFDTFNINISPTLSVCYRF